MKFFQNLGTAKNQEELEILFTKYPQYDKSYICAATLQNRVKQKQWIESLWSIFHPFAEKNFLEESKISYAQRTWEMYLGALLLKKNFNLVKISGTNHPDICFKTADGKTYWVEAIAPERGTGINAVPEKNSYSGQIDGLYDPMVLRVASSFKTKADKFQEYINKKIVQKDDHLIVAINTSKFSSFSCTDTLGLRSFYGYHHLTYNVTNEKTGNSTRSSITNKNNSKVLVSSLNSTFFNSISGVLLCGRDIGNMSIENIGAEIMIYPNLVSEKKLKKSMFQFGTEYYSVDFQTIQKKKWN